MEKASTTTWPPTGLVETAFTVNGEEVCLALDPRESLLAVLRERLVLTGTKKGCDQGQCGACTVHIDGRRVVSCLTPAVQVAGQDVMTIEGVAAPDGTLHPLQQAFVDCDALQCGYCPPGMLCAAADLLQRTPQPTEEQVRQGLRGNLCRCTGYQNIVDAVLDAAVTQGGAGA